MIDLVANARMMSEDMNMSYTDEDREADRREEELADREYANGKLNNIDETLKKILKIVKVAVKNHEDMMKWRTLHDLTVSDDEVKEYKVGQGQVQV